MKWIQEIVPVVGKVSGIIFMGIGLIMGFQALLKLAIPEEPTIDTYACKTEYRPYEEFKGSEGVVVPVELSVRAPGGGEVRLTEEERKVCLVEKAESERIYKTNRLRNQLIDGAVFAAVGSLFYLLFNRKEEVKPKSKK